MPPPVLCFFSRYSDLREDDRAARSRLGVIDRSAASIDNDMVFAAPPACSCRTVRLSPSQPGSTDRALRALCCAYSRAPR